MQRPASVATVAGTENEGIAHVRRNKLHDEVARVSAGGSALGGEE